MEEVPKLDGRRVKGVRELRLSVLRRLVEVQM